MISENRSTLTLVKNGEHDYGPDVVSRSEDIIKNAPNLFHNINFETPTPRYPNWKPYFKANDTSLPWWLWALGIAFIITSAATIWFLVS